MQGQDSDKCNARIFAPQYCVDVLKVGVPVTMAYVQGSSASDGTFVHTRADALELFRVAAEATSKPFLYLSAGVSNRVFNEALELATEAGIHFCGVLCGRATWKDGVGVFVRVGGGTHGWNRRVQNIRSIKRPLSTLRPGRKNILRMSKRSTNSVVTPCLSSVSA